MKRTAIQLGHWEKNCTLKLVTGKKNMDTNLTTGKNCSTDLTVEKSCYTYLTLKKNGDNNFGPVEVLPIRPCRAAVLQGDLQHDGQHGDGPALAAIHSQVKELGEGQGRMGERERGRWRGMAVGPRESGKVFKILEGPPPEGVAAWDGRRKLFPFQLMGGTKCVSGTNEEKFGMASFVR